MHPIDTKIAQLLRLTDEFVFPAYYTHTDCVMWKISNSYTKLAGETLVLCPLSDGIERALDLATEAIKQKINEFYHPKK